MKKILLAAMFISLSNTTITSTSLELAKKAISTADSLVLGGGLMALGVLHFQHMSKEIIEIGFNNSNYRYFLTHNALYLRIVAEGYSLLSNINKKSNKQQKIKNANAVKIIDSIIISSLLSHLATVTLYQSNYDYVMHDWKLNSLMWATLGLRLILHIHKTMQPVIKLAQE